MKTLCRRSAAAFLLSLTLAASALGQGGDAAGKAELVARVGEEHGPLPAYLVEKFVNYKLTPNCWAKVLEKESRGVEGAYRFAGNIAAYAKRMGYGDLEETAGSTPVSQKAAMPRVEKLVAGFQDKFSFTVQGAGVECDEQTWRLFFGYAGTIGDLVGDHYSSVQGWTPKGGAAHITLTLSPTAKDIAVQVSPDATKFTITGPVGVEPGEWDTKITRGMARGGK